MTKSLSAPAGLAVLASALVLFTLPAPAAHARPAASAPIDRLAFHQDMRKLWEDHITWTRLAIVSFAAGLPDLKATEQRLLRNQVDIGNAVKPFYGKAAGNALTALLRQHILEAVDLLAAAKAGETAKLAAAKKAWYANGNRIAAFLTHANPQSWPLSMTREMMKDHLDLTLAEAGARLRGDWRADVAAYDRVHAEILHMADMLADGIVSQFPRAFAQ